MTPQALYDLLEKLEGKVKTLVEFAMNPSVPADKCLEARIRVHQLNEAIALIKAST